MISMHPGEYISFAYLEPGVISFVDLSKDLNVTPELLNSLLRGEYKVTKDFAIVLSRVLGRSENSWFGMQTLFDMGSR